jgi:hypothetical protein
MLYASLTIQDTEGTNTNFVRFHVTTYPTE